MKFTYPLNGSASCVSIVCRSPILDYYHMIGYGGHSALAPGFSGGAVFRGAFQDLDSVADANQGTATLERKRWSRSCDTGTKRLWRLKCSVQLERLNGRSQEMKKQTNGRRK